MVGVPSFPVWNDDCARTKFSDGRGEAKLVFARGVNVGVRYAERAAIFHFEDFGGECGFFCAGLRSPESSHFAGGEIEDSRFVASLRHFEHGTAASEFDVVWMSGDGEKVEVHGSS